MFLAQALSTGRSCQQAVHASAVKRLAGGLPHCSTHTGGYRRARQRLPLDMVSTLAQLSGQMIAGRSPRELSFKHTLLPQTLVNSGLESVAADLW